MTWKAICTDCPWSFEGEDQVEAADALERHARKERHHVDIRQRVTA
ncbi:MAG: hypothetical protein ACOCY6_03170 [Halodesulfurarchaeum sp.]